MGTWDFMKKHENGQRTRTGMSKMAQRIRTMGREMGGRMGRKMRRYGRRIRRDARRVRRFMRPQYAQQQQMPMSMGMGMSGAMMPPVMGGLGALPRMPRIHMPRS